MMGRLLQRFLCRIGRHDWSQPSQIRDELHKKSTRRREEYVRFCWRITTGCTARRTFRHKATFTPEQRRRAGQ